MKTVRFGTIFILKIISFSPFLVDFCVCKANIIKKIPPTENYIISHRKVSKKI